MLEKLTVSVSTIYALSMPKYIYLQLHGVEKPARVQADTVEKQGTQSLVLKQGSTQVGEFQQGMVHGWWIQDEEEPKGTF